MIGNINPSFIELMKAVLYYTFTAAHPVCRILEHVAHRLSEQPCFSKINGIKFAARVSYLVTYRSLLL